MRKLSASLLVTVFLLISGLVATCDAQTPLPDTPAVHQGTAWLEMFNIKTWPSPSFAISLRFIYKTVYVPTKTGTLTFVLLSRKFTKCDKFQRSGGRAATGQILRQNSLDTISIDTISIVVIRVRPNTVAGFDTL